MSSATDATVAAVATTPCMDTGRLAGEAWGAREAATGSARMAASS